MLDKGVRCDKKQPKVDAYLMTAAARIELLSLVFVLLVPGIILIIIIGVIRSRGRSPRCSRSSSRRTTATRRRSGRRAHRDCGVTSRKGGLTLRGVGSALWRFLGGHKELVRLRWVGSWGRHGGCLGRGLSIDVVYHNEVRVLENKAVLLVEKTSVEACPEAVAREEH